MAWTNDPSGIGLSAVPASGGTGWQAWTSSEALSSILFTFEDITKTDYSTATLSPSGYSWSFISALVGTSSQDYKIESKSARLRGHSDSEIVMLTDKYGGIGTVSFYYRCYGNTGSTACNDSQIPYNVDYSTDGGSNWINVGSFTPTFTVTQFIGTINQSGNVRIRIKANGGDLTSNKRCNIDNLELTGYSDINEENFSAYFPYYSNLEITYPGLQSSDGTAFRMYAPGVGLSAVRTLIEPLMVDGNISIRFGINYRDNGDKGVLIFKDASLVTGFRATNNKYQVFYSDAWHDTSIQTYYSDSVFQLDLLRYDPPGPVISTLLTYVYRINYEGFITPIESIPAINTNSDVNRIVFYSNFVSTDPAYKNENTLCFNYLTGYNAYR